MKSVTKISKPKEGAEIGERIKYVRSNLLISQKDLADKLNKKREEITMYENGDRTIDIYTLREISKILNVSTDYLLGITNFESPDISKIAINELTGLSDDAINNLIYINKYHSGSIMNTINYLLEQEKLCPDEYYEMLNEEKLTEENKKVLAKAFEEWKEKKYVKLFTNINNYFNVNVESNQKIHITNNDIKRENEINDLYDLATTKEVITSNDIVDIVLLKEIEKLLELAKKNYTCTQNENEGK